MSPQPCKESTSLSAAEMLKAAVFEGEAERTRAVLDAYPELRATLDQPLPGEASGQHALFAAVQRSDRATIDVLLQAGADIHKRTEWWAGGIGVLDECDPALVSFLTGRGAVLDAHSAARLGMAAKLEELISADPAVVHLPGGDGRMPLHFASTVEVAALLLAHGADMDARDLNHESTPAQHMLRVMHKRHYPSDRQDVARFLLARGCQSDVLMAAALGDVELVRSHLERDPRCIAMCVSEAWFPKQDPRSSGTIYMETLGAGRTAHTVARDFGHEELFQFLMEHTPADMKLTLACEIGDEEIFQALLSIHPDVAKNLSEQEQRKLPNAAVSNNTEAVRLMLEAGWPVDTRGDMGATALHWAAYNGNAAMVREILRFHPSLELLSERYNLTALGWALHGSGNGWHRATGDFAGAIRALTEAGAALPANPESLDPSMAALEELRRVSLPS